MKKSIRLLATVAVLALCSPIATIAATQVYDLNADWSATANPNGAWSYRQGDSLLISTPLPWVGTNYTGCSGAYLSWPPNVPAVEKVTGTVQAYPCILFVSEGYIEDGDMLVVPGVGGNIRWTAPKSGTIDISGVTWSVDIWSTGSGRTWTLSLNESHLSGGNIGVEVSDYPRSSPYDLSLGSGGAPALHNIPVQAGDQLVLASSGFPFGLNLTITLTTDTVDPVSAIEDLALVVVAMNLQNGIENSLDSKLDAALDALVDANFNNDGAACNSLAAFINAVQAQGGKKITNAQADQLITSAQQIRGSLNCGN